MKYLGAFLLIAAAVSVVPQGCAAAPPASGPPALEASDRDEWRSVSGRWKGHYTNSLGNEGESFLRLREESDGSLHGTWDDVEVTGRRINPDTIELHGESAKRSYQITATRDGHAMRLTYIATRLDSGGSYDGKAKLYRQH